MLIRSIQVISGLIGHAARAYVLAVLFVEVFVGFALVALSFWVAYDGSLLRGTLAGLVGFLLVTFVALVLAVYYSSLSTAKRAVMDAGIGGVVFNELFDRAFGVHGEENDERTVRAKIPTRLSAAEVKGILDDAARSLLSDRPAASFWSAPAFWLAKQIRKICVWATVKVILKSCSREGNSVNLYELRDRLAAIIDDGVVSWLKACFMRVAVTTTLIVCGITIVLALGIRQLPI